MKLIVGLGNPGKEYGETRHNIGFTILDEFANRHSQSFKSEDKFKALCAKFKLGDEQIIIAKPQTFMNLSGTAIQKIAKFYKIEPKDILVVYDEVSIDYGRIRLSVDRGAGGHHGIEDTIEKLGGAKDFYRLRVGVGPDPGGDRRADYVLSKFSKVEKKSLLELIDFSIELIEKWLNDPSLGSVASYSFIQ